MLQEWIQRVDISTDPFDTFVKREQCVSCILNSTSTIDLQLGLHSLVDILLTSKNVDAVILYSEVCHYVFKDGRRHIEDVRHPVYVLLTELSQREGSEVQAWISQQLQAIDAKQLVPFIVWMIDIMKLSAMLKQDDWSIFNYVNNQEEWIKGMTHLWYHSHITVVRRSMEWVHLYCLNGNLHHSIIEQLVQYFNVCKSSISVRQLSLLQQHDRTEFFHQPIPPSNSDTDDTTNSLTLDRESLNLLIQITVACISNLIKYQLPFDPVLASSMRQCIMTFENSLSSIRSFISNICGSNDQTMIRLQLDILNIYLSTRQGQDQPFSSPWLRVLSPLLAHINPHTVFIYFLERAGLDYELLIDLLMSDETDMLVFLIRYLKYVEQQPIEFLHAIDQVLGNKDDDEGSDSVDAVLGILYQVRLIVQSDSFPYNASALARRISSVLESINQVQTNALHE